VRNIPTIEKSDILFKSICDKNWRKFAIQYKQNGINFEFAFFTDVEEYSEMNI